MHELSERSRFPISSHSDTRRAVQHRTGISYFIQFLQPAPTTSNIHYRCCLGAISGRLLHITTRRQALSPRAVSCTRSLIIIAPARPKVGLLGVYSTRKCSRPPTEHRPSCHHTGFTLGFYLVLGLYQRLERIRLVECCRCRALIPNMTFWPI